MALSSHIEQLKQKHAELEDKLQEALRHPSANDEEISFDIEGGEKLQVCETKQERGDKDRIKRVGGRIIKGPSCTIHKSIKHSPEGVVNATQEKNDRQSFN